MEKTYDTEREGQIEFFDNFGVPWKENDEVLADNTDGVWNGNLFEFKLSISNPNKVLFQAIKYLSRMRIKGEDIPATILLIDLNNRKAYQYKSENYKTDIQKIYTGAASKNNSGFTAEPPDITYKYSKNYSNYMLDSSNLRKQIKSEKKLEESIMPIDIDENCIVGWAERYYKENPTASKGDFLGDETGVAVKITGEIREPRHFKGRINPYKGETNEKFKYLMDCLNDRLNKKALGAFYTNSCYALKSALLVLTAVNNMIDAGKTDYVIIDRCAGTGNLEAALIGIKDKNGSDLISHCIVSTYEYYEYKVLNERIGDLVREIIPPTEAQVDYQSGKITNADAMSKEFIENDVIKQYLDKKDVGICLFENPPYKDESSGVSKGIAERVGKRKSFVLEEMKKEVKGVATNELANQFIWSGFKYYLRDETDYYVLYSPIKYWKQYSFVDKTPIKAFSFNRKHFHATESTILCVLWKNKKSNIQKINSEIYDVDIKNNDLKFEGTHIIKKVHNPASKNYSKISFDNTDEINLHCAKDGTEAQNKIVRVKSYNNQNIIGYLEADSFQISPLKRNITRCALYDGNGCFITKQNYLNLLPLWVSKHIPLVNWYEKDIYATTSDGGDAYTKDQDFLKSCLIYSCLSNQNKCLSFDGSDNRFYKNELCFDVGTIASADLSKMKLDDEEQELIDLFKKILNEAKATGKCNSKYTYGVYQITKEINTFTKTGSGKRQQITYDYPQLNGDLDTLRTMIKEYYKTHITKKMFKYELIK